MISQEFPPEHSQKWTSSILPILFLIGLFASYPITGSVITIVVGAADLLALIAWFVTSRHKVIGRRLIPLYLATLAGLQFHIREEWTHDFAALARNIAHSSAPSQTVFMNVILFTVPILYVLGGIGLYYHRPFADYLAWTLFCGPGFMEWTHYVFPLFEGGSYHYTAGMWTAWVPMVPGITALCWIAKNKGFLGSPPTTA